MMTCDRFLVGLGRFLEPEISKEKPNSLAPKTSPNGRSNVQFLELDPTLQAIASAMKVNPIVSRSPKICEVEQPFWRLYGR